MAKVLTDNKHYTDIAEAIRDKNGTETTYKPSEMAAAIEEITTGGAVEAITIESNGTYTAPDGIDGYNPITVNVPQDGGPPDEAFVITGSCNYRFGYGGWDWFINEYGNRVTTTDIQHALSMFDNSRVKKIPFTINFKSLASGNMVNKMFSDCTQLTEIPKLQGCKPSNMENMFSKCQRVRNIPEDIADWFDWSLMESATNGSGYSRAYSCYYLFSLRSVPMDFLNHACPNCGASYSYLYYGFRQCYALDELVDLPIPYTATWTSNAFANTFVNCNRLKNITFAMPDGQPYVVNWKAQLMDLSTNVGYGSVITNITNYNSGITADKAVSDDADYQALKNDPDWFTMTSYYSRYNHDSAVATINSLPDTSAYLATAGGTNTIKFKGTSGIYTDGGGIEDLTEAEIAVATAKGWTVTFA